jgi:hypothetical protein
MTLRSLIEIVRRNHPDTPPNMVRILINQGLMRLYEEAPLFYPKLSFTLEKERIDYPFDQMVVEGDFEYSTGSVIVHQVFFEDKIMKHSRQDVLFESLVWDISAGKQSLSVFYNNKTKSPWMGDGKECFVLIHPRAIKLSDDEDKEPYLDEDFHIGLVDYVQQRLYAEKQVLQMSSWHKERWSETLLLAKRRASRQGRDTYNLMSEDF